MSVEEIQEEFADLDIDITDEDVLLKLKVIAHYLACGHIILCCVSEVDISKHLPHQQMCQGIPFL